LDLQFAVINADISFSAVGALGPSLFKRDFAMGIYLEV
jgi:hypothetical protein